MSAFTGTLSTKKSLSAFRLADNHAKAVLTGEEDGVTCRDKAVARGYLAQRERTHTAVQVEIGHRIEFKGLRPVDTGDSDVLEVASLASQDRIDAPKDAPAVPALPE